jgi:hypothetical protein
VSKIKSKQVAITDRIRIPKGVRSRFTPMQTVVLAAIYRAGEDNHYRTLTIAHLAQRAGVNMRSVRQAILLAGELGVLEIAVDHEGNPTIVRNVAIKAKLARTESRSTARPPRGRAISFPG